MDNSNKEETFAKLSEKIEQLDAAYYAGSAMVSDEQYDALSLQLANLAKDLGKESIATTKVGAPVSGEFPTVYHDPPMLSLEKVYNQEDLIKKLGKFPGQKWIAWPKFDGTSLSVVYKDGKMVRIATRGDGHKGDDLSKHAHRIVNLPQQLPEPWSGEIRGEVVLLKSQFKEFNEKYPEKALKNVRNGAAGSLRALDKKEKLERKLWFYAYDVIGLKTHLLHFLQKMNLPMDRGVELSLEEMGAYADAIEADIEQLDYAIDGVVFRLADEAEYQKAGTTGHHPKGALALKLTPNIVQTRLTGINWQVARTGTIAPVGLLEPILVSGAMVSRVSLHNLSEIEKHDLKVGDPIEIVRAGEVIPHLLRTVTEGRDGSETPVVVPTNCPSCGHALDIVGESKILECPNKIGCEVQRKFIIKHWASRAAADIEHLGQKQIEKLMDEGLVKTIPDIYRLSREDLLLLDKVKEKSADRLLQSIQNSKNIGLQKALVGLSVPYCSTGLIKKLIQSGYNSIEKLCNASQEDLEAVDGIGEKLSIAITQYLHEPATQKTIEELIQLGIDFSDKSPKPQSTGLLGKKFVITGTLSVSREEWKQRLEQNGAIVVGSISKNTDFLLAGENAGSKLSKAKALGVAIVDEQSINQQID